MVSAENLKIWELVRKHIKKAESEIDNPSVGLCIDAAFRELGVIFDDQKGLDSMTPRFKEGDWIFIEEVKGFRRGPFLIKTVGKYGYDIDTPIERESFIAYSQEPCVRPWDISEAEEGDILSINFDERIRGRIYHWTKIVLFKSLGKNGVIGHGVTLRDGERWFIDQAIPYYSETWTICLKPATEKEKELFLSLLVSSGYVFDSRKKKLIKLLFRPGDIVRKKGKEKSESYHISLITEKGYFCGYTPLFPIECQDQFELVQTERLTEFEQKLAEILMNREYEGSTETEEDIEKAMAYYGKEAKKVAPELLAIIEKEI